MRGDCGTYSLGRQVEVLKNSVVQVNSMESWEPDRTLYHIVQ